MCNVHHFACALPKSVYVWHQQRVSSSGGAGCLDILGSLSTCACAPAGTHPDLPICTLNRSLSTSAYLHQAAGNDSAADGDRPPERLGVRALCGPQVAGAAVTVIPATRHVQAQIMASSVNT
jgi:hypothetical protein